MKTATVRHDIPGGFAEVGTVTFEGRSFASGGAMADGERIVCYIGTPDRGMGCYAWAYETRGLSRQSAHAGPVTDWSGATIGTYVVTGKWTMRCWSPIGGQHMYSFRVTLLNGERYNARGMGVGLSATGKRAKAS